MSWKPRAEQGSPIRRSILALLLLGGTAWAVWPIKSAPRPGSPAALAEKLSSPDPEVRDQAAQALSKLGADAVPALVRMLQHPELRVRQNTFRLIHRHGPYVVGLLPHLTRTLEDPSTSMRNAAANLIGLIGQPLDPVPPSLVREHAEAAEALREIIDNSENPFTTRYPEIRRLIYTDLGLRAARGDAALSRVNNPMIDGTPVSGLILQWHEQEDRRAEIESRLAEVDTEVVVAHALEAVRPFVIWNLYVDRNPLRQLEILTQVVRPHGPKVRAPLAKALAAPAPGADRFTRMAVLGAWSELGLPAGRHAALLRSLAFESDETTRETATRILINDDSHPLSEKLALLQEQLQSRDPEAVLFASRVILYLGTDARPLLGSIRDAAERWTTAGDPEGALELRLASMVAEHGFAGFDRALEEPNGELARLAGRVLRWHSVTRAKSVPSLRNRLAHAPWSRARTSLLAYLEEHPDAAALFHALGTTQDAKVDLLQFAEGELQTPTGTPSNVSAALLSYVIERVHDEESKVQRAAFRVLQVAGPRGDRGAPALVQLVPALLHEATEPASEPESFLGSHDFEAGEQAALALEAWIAVAPQDAAAREAALSSLRHPSLVVRSNGARAWAVLEDVTGEEFESMLAAVRTSGDAISASDEFAPAHKEVLESFGRAFETVLSKQPTHARRLVELLGHPVPAVHRCAMSGLEGLADPDPKVLRQVLTHVPHADNHTANVGESTAYKHLHKLRRRALPVLMEFATTEENRVREIVARFLGVLAWDASDMLPRLERLAKDERAHVRETARVSIELIRGTRTSDASSLFGR